MNIELGSAAGGVASAVGRGVSTAPSLVSRIGPALEAPGGSIFSDSPIASLEGFKPMPEVKPAELAAGFDLGGEISFNQPLVGNIVAEPFSAPSVAEAAEEDILTEANHWLGTAKEPVIEPVNGPDMVEPKIIREASYWFTDVESKVVKPAEVIMPGVESEVVPIAVTENFIGAQAAPQIKTEPQISTGPMSSTSAEPVLKEEIEEEEVVEGKIDTERDQQKEAEGEDYAESKIKIVEAEKVSGERRRKISRAVKKAKEKNTTVAEALPEEFWKDISPLVGNGKDWTVDLTVEALQINPNQYSSIEEAEKASVSIVAENAPVEVGESGRQATVDEVRKVTGGERHIFSSKTPAQIVLRRVIKKKREASKDRAIPVVLEDKVETNTETTLKDLGLSEVLQPQKAA